MSWGYKIALVYIGFVGLIITLVVGSTQYKVNLVTEDYYQAEVRYEERIQEIRNSKALDTPVQITMDHEGQQLVIQFPEGVVPTGNIHLYRPSNSELDAHLEVFVNEKGIQRIDVADLGRGLWSVQVSWKNGDTPYFDEKRIVL